MLQKDVEQIGKGQNKGQSLEGTRCGFQFPSEMSPTGKLIGHAVSRAGHWESIWGPPSASHGPRLPSPRGKQVFTDHGSSEI